MEILKDYPDDIEILVDGYEEGADEIDRISTTYVKEKINAHCWQGKYDDQVISGKKVIILRR